MRRRPFAAGAVLTLVASSLTSAGAEPVAPLDMVPPVDGPVVRHFEPPPTPFAAGHRGIDLEAGFGDPVVAAAGGIVAFAGSVGGVRSVSIDHPGGLRTTYSFLSDVVIARGATVAQGDLIGHVGTGHPGTETPHVHLGLREGQTYLDPEPVLVESFRRNRWRVIGLAPTV